MENGKQCGCGEQGGKRRKGYKGEKLHSGLSNNTGQTLELDDG